MPQNQPRYWIIWGTGMILALGREGQHVKAPRLEDLCLEKDAVRHRRRQGAHILLGFLGVTLVELHQGAP
jgi:hypothetical protein